ncbi:glutathione S-transferase U18-like [Amaranthus tricolor]|uniref:glutathione S-transferase U18-like n=1 Tax=Amaranthus tricolor TaxID=29722 RepID=UPI002590F599|nr:glutathione S-transferase U18-like [Amaranthus tricolor]
MAKEVKLLGAWPSPFVMRCRIALHIKSVDYEFIQETMQPKSELLLKSNPVYKKIPVLLHNHLPICESLIILHYIDEAFSSGSAPSLLPSHPYDRAIHRFWAAYIDDKWFPSLNGMRKAETEEEKTAAINEVKEGLILLEDAFEKCSKGKPYFNVDHIGYLDIALGSYLGWLRVVETMNNVVLLEQEKTPKLCAWAHKFCGDDAVKDYMPETDKLIEFAKILMAKYKAAAST